MSNIWQATSYDSERRRLIYCFDEFYGTVAELVQRFCSTEPRILDLGAGTGILSAAILARVPKAQLHLLDVSPDMLAQAIQRFSITQTKACIHSLTVQSLVDPLPLGKYDAIVSALAIHHLSDDEKKSLYARIYESLTPNGIFVNAEQILGNSERQQQLFESIHLDRARALGSSEDEIDRAIQRMKHDRCTPLREQLAWLEEIGYREVDCYFRSFRFAVFAGFK
jgi:tRNA (cmo5U34)-methyltransferase